MSLTGLPASLEGYLLGGVYPQAEWEPCNARAEEFDRLAERLRILREEHGDRVNTVLATGTWSGPAKAEFERLWQQLNSAPQHAGTPAGRARQATSAAATGQRAAQTVQMPSDGLGWLHLCEAECRATAAALRQQTKTTELVRYEMRVTALVVAALLIAYLVWRLANPTAAEMWRQKLLRHYRDVLVAIKNGGLRAILQQLGKASMVSAVVGAVIGALIPLLAHVWAVSDGKAKWSDLDLNRLGLAALEGGIAGAMFPGSELALAKMFPNLSRGAATLIISAVSGAAVATGEMVATGDWSTERFLQATTSSLIGGLGPLASGHALPEAHATSAAAGATRTAHTDTTAPPAHVPDGGGAPIHASPARHEGAPPPLDPIDGRPGQDWGSTTQAGNHSDSPTVRPGGPEPRAPGHGENTTLAAGAAPDAHPAPVHHNPGPRDHGDTTSAGTTAPQAHNLAQPGETTSGAPPGASGPHITHGSADPGHRTLQSAAPSQEVATTAHPAEEVRRGVGLAHQHLPGRITVGEARALSGLADMLPGLEGRTETASNPPVIREILGARSNRQLIAEFLDAVRRGDHAVLDASNPHQLARALNDNLIARTGLDADAPRSGDRPGGTWRTRRPEDPAIVQERTGRAIAEHAGHDPNALTTAEARLLARLDAISPGLKAGDWNGGLVHPDAPRLWREISDGHLRTWSSAADADAQGRYRASALTEVYLDALRSGDEAVATARTAAEIDQAIRGFIHRRVGENLALDAGLPELTATEISHLADLGPLLEGGWSRLGGNLLVREEGILHTNAWGDRSYSVIGEAIADMGGKRHFAELYLEARRNGVDLTQELVPSVSHYDYLHRNDDIYRLGAKLNAYRIERTLSAMPDLPMTAAEKHTARAIADDVLRRAQLDRRLEKREGDFLPNHLTLGYDHEFWRMGFDAAEARLVRDELLPRLFTLSGYESFGHSSAVAPTHPMARLANALGDAELITTYIDAWKAAKRGDADGLAVIHAADPGTLESAIRGFTDVHEKIGSRVMHETGFLSRDTSRTIADFCPDHRALGRFDQLMGRSDTDLPGPLKDLARLVGGVDFFGTPEDMTIMTGALRMGPPRSARETLHRLFIAAAGWHKHGYDAVDPDPRRLQDLHAALDADDPALVAMALMDHVVNHPDQMWRMDSGMVMARVSELGAARQPVNLEALAWELEEARRRGASWNVAYLDDMMKRLLGLEDLD
ncbi:hypothetical protein FH608_006440 [Nonomuraea phyllanthi]|uniref:Uncharacterized protein n=1 Tax=Nonomuraea phyllanthi TaxID=2219224 RepID=A0A5C4WS59_9ACTN|nr:hypothetical protein [Nonomuraea phyllanthi]KAB8196389.1 hypothetical protein FH608_006440 [Nonomuraea phyllanthi]